jgi:hypothetical protein
LPVAFVSPGGHARSTAEYRLVKLQADPVGNGGDKGARGNREDPGPDDVAGNAPAHGTGSLNRAHTHNGTGDGVRGRDRNTEPGGQEQGQGTTRFRAEAPTGLSLVIFWPMVLTIRQPPNMVPAPIAA